MGKTWTPVCMCIAVSPSPNMLCSSRPHEKKKHGTWSISPVVCGEMMMSTSPVCGIGQYRPPQQLDPSIWNSTPVGLFSCRFNIHALHACIIYLKALYATSGSCATSQRIRYILRVCMCGLCICGVSMRIKHGNTSVSKLRNAKFSAQECGISAQRLLHRNSPDMEIYFQSETPGRCRRCY